MAYSLQKAREYEKIHSKNIDERERPLYHVSPAVGWLNDPNGFSMYQGECHLFYQYYPYESKWGPMHWGHYKTKDFLHWEMLPAALAPEESYESGCYSGSAVEMPDGRQLLMYTAHYEETPEYGKKIIRETQCMAVGNGIDYEKYQNNPVLTGEDLPEGGYKGDFRDPKIWMEDGKYYAVAVNRREDKTGAVLLFQSEDGFDWSFHSILQSCRGEYGEMWECPDFFSIDDKSVLVVSPMNMQKQGLEFHSGHGVIAMVGTWNKDTLAFNRERVQAVDYGLDFYAPQSMETPDGRRVMIGWMQSWAASTCQPEGAKWFCMMTLPRELELREGRLIQNPVREIETCWANTVSREGVLVSREVMLEGIKGRTVDLTVELDLTASTDCSQLEIKLAADEKVYTSIVYSAKEDTITLDRSNSGVRHDIVNARTMEIRKIDNKIKLRILLDRFSVEIFANDGEQAFTACLYDTPIEAENIMFSADGQACLSIEKHDIVL